MRPESSILIFGLSRSDLFLLLLDMAIIGSSMFLRSLAQMGSSLSAFGLCCLGFSSSLLDFAHLELPLFVHSLACLDSFLSAYGLTCLELSSLVLDMVHLGSVTWLQRKRSDTRYGSWAGSELGCSGGYNFQPCFVVFFNFLC